jgi:REP element-mobilizing transposase RayT
MSSFHARKPTRLSGFNYASAVSFFITICLQDMSQHRFGRVNLGQLILTDAGELMSSIWESTFDRFPGASPDCWIVMPNHLHAIVCIGDDPAIGIPNLSSVVGAFKSASTVEYARRVLTGEFPPFDRALWQRSFYDRVLGTDRAIAATQSYIEGNPARWIERTING